MKRLIISLCCLFLFTACAGQPENNLNKHMGLSTEGLSTETRITRYLHDLSGNEFSGRQAGSAGEAWAGLYLASFVQNSGLLPQGDQGTYFQAFPIKRYEPVLIDRRMTFRPGLKTQGTISENILGLLPGKSDEIIIVSAHYDHLGIIENSLYPGANDNASGVATIMELITAMRNEKPRYTVLFAFWGAEEMGLLGSEYFCTNPPVSLEKIKYILNLDSIGTTLPDKNLLGWRATTGQPDTSIAEVISSEGWTINWETSDRHTSDHQSFAKREIDGCTLLSPRWLDKNHTPYDTVEAINTKLLAEMVLAIKKALLA